MMGRDSSPLYIEKKEDAGGKERVVFSLSNYMEVTSEGKRFPSVGTKKSSLPSKGEEDRN